MAETQYQVTQRTPEIEAYELGLLQAAQGLTDKALFDPRFETLLIKLLDYPLLNNKLPR